MADVIRLAATRITIWRSSTAQGRRCVSGAAKRTRLTRAANRVVCAKSWLFGARCDRPRLTAEVHHAVTDWAKPPANRRRRADLGLQTHTTASSRPGGWKTRKRTKTTAPIGSRHPTSTADTGRTSAYGRRMTFAATHRYGEATAKRCHSPGTPLSS